MAADGMMGMADAAAPVGKVLREKPRLLVEPPDPDRTVAALRDLLVEAGCFFDRGVPVRLAHDQMQHGYVAQPLSADGLILAAHQVTRPYELRDKKDGLTAVNVRLPKHIALAYLEWRGEWRLPPLNGIASAPLLRSDGSIHCAAGYDDASGMWCENVPDVTPLVPEAPTDNDAKAALRTLRRRFRTFCFADAETAIEPASALALVDINKDPGRDESAFLAALLTAVCRPSLDRAPGLLLRAAPMSGAGAGKGLLARCICAIAFGRPPYAVTGGGNAEELEKRISAELMEGSPALFLDNLNNIVLKSDLLASAITERPARVRVLGKSQMVPLNASAFIVLTGNGLSVSEDLARRFIEVAFDPGTEDPEARRFQGDVLAEVTGQRRELLAACLTIWCWGRLASPGTIPAGRPLGSFAQWCAWVRDPLLALGCKDPVERLAEANARDSRRMQVAELFETWWQHHQGREMKLSDLHEEVRNAAVPGGSRQAIAARIEKLAGTRLAGVMLVRLPADGKYRLMEIAGNPETIWNDRGASAKRPATPPDTLGSLGPAHPYGPDHKKNRRGDMTDHRAQEKQAGPVGSATLTPCPPMPPHASEPSGEKRVDGWL